MKNANDYTLNEIVAVEEDREHEFKSLQRVKDPAKEIIDKVDAYIDAFLNTNGGTLYFGIEDDGRITGIALDRRQRDDLRKRIDDIVRQFNPSVEPELYEVRFVPVHGEDIPTDLCVIEIAVRKGTASLYWIGSQKAYLRRHGSNELMPRDMLERRLLAGKVSPAPKQIPPPPRDFTGREAELREVESAVETGKASIVSVRGTGGVGKTALARKLADRLAPFYPDGQIEIELQGMTNPISPAEAMAYVIHAYSPQDPLPKTEVELRGQYFSKLRDKRTLLLLDNASSADQVEPLIPPDTCLLIVTSRQRFYLQGMHEMDLDILPRDVAHSLLLKIAPHIGSEADEIAKLCGFLPMALELAGRALRERRDLTPADYARRLADSESRFEKVEAALSLSLNLLTPGLQQLWYSLSVFPVGFDNRAVAAIWDMDTTLVADVLSTFVHYSLAEYEDRNRRYHLHDLARSFAASWLSDAARDALQRGHAAHYVSILHEAITQYEHGGDSLKRGLDLFDSEWGNTQAGQAWAAANAEKDDMAAQLCSDYANAWGLLSLRMHPREQIRWFDSARAAAKRLGHRAAEGAWLGNVGLAYAALSEPRKAIELYTDALAIARETDDRHNEHVWLSSLGAAYRALGDFRKSIELYGEALSITRATHDRAGESTALTGLGLAYAALNETETAIDFYEQVLAIARESGDRLTEAACLVNIGDAYFDLSEARKSIAYYEQALITFRELGDHSSEGATLDGLGLAYADLGEARKAVELYEQSLAINREWGDRHGEGTNLGNLGLAYVALKEADKAIQCFEQHLIIARKIGDRLGEGNALGNLGLVYSDLLGEPRKAIEFHEEALAIHREVGHQRGESYALGNLGNAYSVLGERTRAFEYYEQALAISRAINDKRGEGQRLWNMADEFEKMGDHIQAITLGRNALTILEQIGDPQAAELRKELNRWQAPDL